jgi:YYY domain-containing protein
MVDAFVWYLVVLAVGWLAFPIAYRFLRFLPDHGYFLAKPLGVLLWGFFFWLGCSLGLLQNTVGGLLVALAVLVGLSVWALHSEGAGSLGTWVRQHGKLIASGEAVFLIAFAVWVLVRAANPDVLGTEKPMELAFLNAILRSPSFPPHDPWLAGYGISYYYFGYVMVAMLCRLSGVPAEIGFNLGVAMWFALTALATYGLAYDLLSRSGKRSALGWALLAPLFILILGNLEGFLEVLHAGGLFWTQMPGGQWQSGFWTWLGIPELNQPPALPLSWIPNRPGGIVWWRGSRVLQDFDVLGQPHEVIDEFPFFTYMLADLHPHLLAMPFALLATGFSLNLYLGGLVQKVRAFSLGHALSDVRFWLAALVLGALGFLNTWDFPIYVGLFCLAFAFVRYRQEGWSGRLVLEFFALGITLGIAGVLLFLPFYVGFSSQAGGLLPSLSFFTPGRTFWVMFAVFLFPILTWLVWMQRRVSKGQGLGRSFAWSAAVVFGLWVVSFAVGGGIAWLAGRAQTAGGPGTGLAGLIASVYGTADAGQLVGISLVNRLREPGTWLTLLAMLALTWNLLSRSHVEPEQTVGDGDPQSDRTGEQPSADLQTPAGQAVVAPTGEEAQGAVYLAEREWPEEPKGPKVLNLAEGGPGASGFVLLLVLTGLALTLFPEFFYLRDVFGTRMNTIFKLYFEAWIVWGLAAAYASAVLWEKLRGFAGGLWRVGLGILLLAGLAYPFFMLPAKIGGFQGKALTLDGLAFFRQGQPGEWAAIDALQNAPLGTVAEAVGAEYSSYARVSTYSGQPAVLGWAGHEIQWRGNAGVLGTRQQDIATLYETTDWQVAQSILERYGVRYVYVGGLERGTYRVSEGKFRQNLVTYFEDKDVTIYSVPESGGLP